MVTWVLIVSVRCGKSKKCHIKIDEMRSLLYAFVFVDRYVKFNEKFYKVLKVYRNEISWKY